MANPVQTPVSVSREIGGQTLTIETGRIARQAAGSVTVRLGETVILCAVGWGPARPNQSFFPLTVDYRESTSAAGKFPGGFFKREGRPSTKEILTARCIDRPCRPLFPKGFMDEVFVAILVWSFDDKNDPDVLAMIGASAALSISSLPWKGPTGSCRVGRVDGEIVINPTYEQQDASDLDLIVAATDQGITMVEAGAEEVPESEMIDALFAGEEACREISGMITELAKKCGTVKEEFVAAEVDEELKAKVYAYDAKATEANYVSGKHNRAAAMKEVRNTIIEELTAGIEDEAEVATMTSGIKEFYESLRKHVTRREILENNKRADGRGPKDIRQIDIELSVLPRTHGSCLFTRGETQGMISMTLGSVMDDQRVEGLREPVRQKFMLHYNFPSYCVGEAWPNRGPKRREIGHGNLAERSLKPLMPPFEEFPYTIRLRSDITESNGSSSMASVCGGTLALMDGGVRIRRPVAGIAMGLVTDGTNDVILSDILGSEDHSGDMDFKVSGTQKGITALQMDIKIDGLSRELMSTALDQARDGRIHILKAMLAALQKPREEMSRYAPQILQVPIENEKIGALIGPGGSVIRKLQEETKTKIAVDEDRSLAVISGNHESDLETAEQMVRALTSVVEVGTVYESGRVVSIRDFGCFIEVLPGLEGLCHVSELSGEYVENVHDVISEGDVVKVVVINVDPQGRIKLSKKRAENPEAFKDEPVGGGGGGRGGDRGGRGGGRGGDRGGRGGGRGGDRGGRGGDRGGRGGERGGRGGRDRGGRGGGDRDRDSKTDADSSRDREGDRDRERSRSS